jgi:DNA-binding transcriptional ArsR family regulator
MKLMDADTPSDLARLEAKAGEAARLLRLLANEKRLLILCRLIARGEMDVGGMAEAVGLSQSALSQHLAKLREDGLVAFRRESQTLHYRMDDHRAARVLAALKDIFCPPELCPPEHGDPA